MWGGRAGHKAPQNGEGPVRVDNAWPPIVSKEAFDLVQRKMTARGPRLSHPRTVRSPYLLSGFTYCSCGRAMTGRSAKSGQHFYYGCSRAAKQGRAACDAKMLPKEKFERLVVERLRALVLTDDNLEELVKLVNEELQTSTSGLKERMEVVEAELRDAGTRLGRHYDALESGELGLHDLAPRIKEMRRRQSELLEARAKLESEMTDQGIHAVDGVLVKAYAQDLQGLLEESEITERKAFVRSFVDRIDVDLQNVTVHYKLPLPIGAGTENSREVLPIITFGGDRGTRTPNLGDANAALSQLSYIPTNPEDHINKTLPARPF